MQTHRFVQDVEADRLPAEIFARYLSYEREFVETAVLIFGHAMLKAPDHEQRRVLIGVLHGLVEEQLPYFDSAFQEVQASPLPRGGSPPAVRAFGDGMLAVAKHGSYEDILAAMLGAEWTYATWCCRAVARPISSPPLRRWVALHAEAPFLSGVEWLKMRLDALSAGLTQAARERCAFHFRRTLELEIDFHAAAYAVERLGDRRT
jgi:thiaminase/transcriptional activator TenA